PLHDRGPLVHEVPCPSVDPPVFKDALPEVGAVPLVRSMSDTLRRRPRAESLLIRLDALLPVRETSQKQVVEQGSALVQMMQPTGVGEGSSGWPVETGTDRLVPGV